MTFKDIKTLSNSELSLYKIELSDEFESTKSKIQNLCKYLESLEKEYLKAEKEQNNRSIK